MNFTFRKNFKTEIDEDTDQVLISEVASANLLSTLASLYDLLCSTVSLINISFSLTIANYIGSVLISLIFSLFEFYDAMFTHLHNSEKIAVSLSVNLWNFYLLCFVFVIACVCSLSTREAKSTSILLHKALHFQEGEIVQRRVS